jgi:hypothetical protein
VCTRLAAASDQVYQLLAHGRCLSQGSPVSSANKTDRHDITEIMLKVVNYQVLRKNKTVYDNHSNYIKTFILPYQCSTFLCCISQIYK